MASVARSVLIAVPPSRVYQAYTDFASWPRWVPHFRELAPLDGGALAPGFRARIRETNGRVAAVWEVTEVSPGRSFAWRTAFLPGLRLTVDHVAEAEGPGTRATLRLHADGPLGLLIAPVGLWLTRRTFDRSLAALKALLERGGAHLSS